MSLYHPKGKMDIQQRYETQRAIKTKLSLQFWINGLIIWIGQLVISKWSDNSFVYILPSPLHIDQPNKPQLTNDNNFDF